MITKKELKAAKKSKVYSGGSWGMVSLGLCPAAIIAKMRGARFTASGAGEDDSWEPENIRSSLICQLAQLDLMIELGFTTNRLLRICHLNEYEETLKVFNDTLEEEGEDIWKRRRLKK